MKSRNGDDNKHTANDIAEMRDIVHVRQRAGDENVAFPRDWQLHNRLIYVSNWLWFIPFFFLVLLHFELKSEPFCFAFSVWQLEMLQKEKQK